MSMGGPPGGRAGPAHETLEENDNDDGDQSSYSRAVAALTGSIKSHYRPKGSDAESSFARLAVWVEVLGLTDALRRLSVIHVAGTKGKGSTCAFAERVLRCGGRRTGLFTSPHLLDIRERIQIDGVPVSKRLFAEHFWACHDKLQAAGSDTVGWPPYFYFLFLMAVRAFAHAQVDVVVLEVGLGGRLDATNAAPAPAVCGVSALGMDHMEVLGNTLAAIAGEKAGIFKAGVPAFTVPQLPEAAAVLELRARDVGAPLAHAPALDSYGNVPPLGLAGSHQRENAALAVALCREWALRARPLAADTLEQEQVFASGALPESFRRGLAEAEWPGRAQVEADHDAAGLTFFMDGAHTGESTELCAQWFADASVRLAASTGAAGSSAADAVADGGTPDPERLLLFNCMQERDPERLLRPIKTTMDRSGPSAGPLSAAATVELPALAWQHVLRSTWERLQPGVARVRSAEDSEGTAEARRAAGSTAGLGVGAEGGVTTTVLPSLHNAVGLLRARAAQQAPRQVHVLVTGSLYLVGELLRVLKKRG